MSADGKSPPAAESPCVGCGMCCDGTLYVRAKIAPGEEPTIVAHGLECLTWEDKRYFALPCKYESCGRCTNYETRFDVCRTFECALLRRHQAGDVDLGDARQTVAHALDLRRRVTDKDPGARTMSARRVLRERLAEEVANGSPADRGATAARLLNIIALDTFLERWFRNKKGEDQAADAPPMVGSNN